MDVVKLTYTGNPAITEQTGKLLSEIPPLISMRGQLWRKFALSECFL